MTETPSPGREIEENAGGSGGDHYELSGDFRGAVVNIKSTVVGAAEILDIENLPPEPGDPPFQGLQYYDEQDAERFFGRETLIARIAGRLHRNRFLAIIGASGSGKSSLIRAGVIPSLKKGLRLDDGGLPPQGSGNWAYRVITPGARPLESLASALVSFQDSLSAITSLSEELEGSPDSFSLAIKRYLSARSRPHLLLVVDQFEEIFTLSRRVEERDAFIAALTQVIHSEEELPIHVLILLRADYYAQVAQQDALREAVSQFQEFIGAMSRTELVRAIDQPLALGNWQIQEGLIEVILDDVGYEPGALPLLSHALLETWKRRRGRTLTLSGYREAGGVRGAIAETAETVFQRQLTPEQQKVARMIFLRLTEVGEESSDTRRRAAFSELITRSTDEMTIEAVIKILTDSRLVITGTAPPGDAKVVEVAHEAIIREWPTLQEWLDADREGLILQQNLNQDAEEWDRFERDPGVLYRGARLDFALQWAKTHSDSLNILEGEFLEESRNQAEREEVEKRRLARASRIQWVSFAVVALLVIVIGYLAYTNFYVHEPAVMDGLFNIAVAQITDESNSVSTTADSGLSRSLTETIYSTLNDTISQNPNILVWHDGPELDEKYVEIGVASTSSNNLETPEEMAARLHADMVIYGTYDLGSSPPNLHLEYYLAPSDEFDYEDMQGTFAFKELTFDKGIQLEDRAELNSVIGSQVGSLAWIALGLAEARVGHSVEALEAFQEADRIEPGSDTVQFFIGREYLFLVDRESVLEVARDAFEGEAEKSFLKSTRLNPENPRPTIGLAGVYFKRARDLLAESLHQTDRESMLDEALAINEKAISGYQTALEKAGEYQETNLPLNSIAILGLGNAYRLSGEIWIQAGKPGEAKDLFDQAIDRLQTVRYDLEGTTQIRYLTQAYEYLGGVYASQGNLLELNQDYDSSLEAYQSAIEYYDMCIAQGENSQDIIVQREIIDQICQPNRQAVQEIIDNYSGGQG